MIARAFSFVVAFAAFAFLLLVAFPASAGPLRLKTQLSPDTIEVGDTAALTLVAVPGDQVTEGQLPNLPNGLTLVGQMLSPTYQVNMTPNGQVTQQMSARAVFRIRASREGTYALGPPAVIAGGVRSTGDRTTLKVVAKGSLPHQRPDPFDPFGMFGPGSPFQMDQPLEPLEPSYPIDTRFNLDRPRDTGTFLHATVDKMQAVVGEQITLAVYAYADVTQSDPELSDPHEIGTSDFLRQSLLKSDANVERIGYAKAGGRTYAVALLRKYALFPLHAGELEILPMRLHVGRSGDRASETIKVRVSEPPMEHRPAGYTVGDVGHFTVTADVTPREVERGAAISVSVELSGIGNLPGAITVPARPGVTWLEPEVKDDMHVLDAQSGGGPDVWGGTRRFSYVVEPKKEGDLDLGEIAVSFYDPRTHAYDVARAVLGVVHVKPGAAQTQADDAKLLATMPALRKQIGAARGAEAHLDDSNVFLGLLAMPTALFGVALSARRASRRLAERARERKTSPLAELKQRARALATSIDGDDGRAIDGASIRLLEAGAAAHAGVNVRGVGGEGVVSVLARAGVDAETAGELRDLLDACAAARFSPDGVDVDEARKRAARAKSLVARLADRTPNSERSADAPKSGER